MRLQLILTVALTFLASAKPLCAADQPREDLRLSDIDLRRADGNIDLKMNFDFSDLRLGSDREIALIPVIHDDKGNTATMPRVVVAGHNRYIRDLRADNIAPGETLTKPGKTVAYSVSVPFQPWMENATVSVAEDLCGCGLDLISSSRRDIALLDFTPRTFTPSFLYMRPTAEVVKTRNIKGSAYIDFRVNRTDINPDYRRNPEELKKITASIDSIKGDSDITIKTLTIRGFASPEGSLANNERLAKGRTEALASYVNNLYHFPAGVMKTSWVAEDWDGLEAWVKNNEIENRDEILAIIADTSLDPDKREWRLKSRFPQQYRYLLENVYPGLRHSDYAVDYTIRTFTDPAQIREIAFTAPQKLSLEEFYVAGEKMTPGTPEFNRLWDAALSVYPSSEVANLNAANAAMASGNLDRAAALLAKAGDTPEAIYARGNLAAMRGDYTAARQLLVKAQQQGLTQASDAITQLDEYTDWLNRNGKL